MQNYRGGGSQLNCHWWGTQTGTYAAVPQHGPLSLYTKLDGPFMYRGFYFPWYNLCLIIEGL